MSQYSSVAVQTENARVEIQQPSGWLDIPGVASVSESGGDAPTRTVATFQNTIQHVGNVQPPSISISVAGYAPLHPTYKIVDDAKRENRHLTFRYTFAETEVRPTTPAGATAAIAQSTGVVTLTDVDGQIDFTTEELGRGMALKMGTGASARYFVIRTISDTGALTVIDAATLAAPTAQVAAGVYSVVVPPMRRGAFSARIMTAFNLEAASESDLSTTIEIQPIAILPAWELGV